jgi:hypothetical protein
MALFGRELSSNNLQLIFYKYDTIMKNNAISPKSNETQMLLLGFSGGRARSGASCFQRQICSRSVRVMRV